MKVRVNISLDKDTIEALKLLSQLEHTSVSQLITNLTWEQVDKEIKEKMEELGR